LTTGWRRFFLRIGKVGDPNGPELPKWMPYNPEKEQLLNIGDELQMEGFNSAGMDLLAAHAEQRHHAVTGAPRP
jgi:hypothetical protein